MNEKIIEYVKKELKTTMEVESLTVSEIKQRMLTVSTLYKLNQGLELSKGNNKRLNSLSNELNMTGEDNKELLINTLRNISKDLSVEELEENYIKLKTLAFKQGEQLEKKCLEKAFHNPKITMPEIQKASNGCATIKKVTVKTKGGCCK